MTSFSLPYGVYDPPYIGSIRITFSVLACARVLLFIILQVRDSTVTKTDLYELTVMYCIHYVTQYRFPECPRAENQIRTRNWANTIPNVHTNIWKNLHFRIASIC